MFPARPDDSSIDLPTVPVAKLQSNSKEVTVVQDIHFFSSSAGSSKYYCLTAAQNDRCVRLWNPLKVIVNDGENASTKLLARRQQQPSAYSKLPSVFEIQSYQEGFAYDVNSVCVARDSSSSSSSAADLLLAACHKSMILTDLVTAKVTRRLQNFHMGKINKVACFQQNIYVSASFDTTVALWDGKSRNNKPIQVLKDATDSVTDVIAAAANNNTNASPILWTASVDGSVRTYDFRKGIMTCDNLASPVTSMCLIGSGDQQNELAVNCLDGTIRLLDASDTNNTLTSSESSLLNTYSGSHQAGNYRLQVDCLANQNTIVTGSEDGNVAMYDLVSAKCVGEVSGALQSSNDKKPTCTVAAHPKTPVLITASYDASTIIWAAPGDRRWEANIGKEQ